MLRHCQGQQREHSKASQPVSRVLSRMTIHLDPVSPRGLKRPTRKRRGPRHGFPIWSCSGRGLPCHCRYRQRGALLPHLFTLAGSRCCLGGLFSVALSVGFRPPGVTWRPALRSPDFPPAPFGASGHPAGLPNHYTRKILWRLMQSGLLRQYHTTVNCPIIPRSSCSRI